MGVVLTGRPEDGPPVRSAAVRLNGRPGTPPPPPAPPAAAAAAAPAPANEELWSFLRILVVITALIALTVFLALHYSAEKDAAAMLGIVIPVLTAILGLGLGYASGNTAGKAKGQADKAQAVHDGRQALADHLLDLTEPGRSPEGTGQDATIGHIRAALAAVKTG